jgi:hypothetical protein
MRNRLLIIQEGLQNPVIPAKAGIQAFNTADKSVPNWMPAFAGMTAAGLLQTFIKPVYGIAKSK